MYRQPKNKALLERFYANEVCGPMTYIPPPESAYKHYARPKRTDRIDPRDMLLEMVAGINKGLDDPKVTEELKKELKIVKLSLTEVISTMEEKDTIR